MLTKFNKNGIIKKGIDDNSCKTTNIKIHIKRRRFT